MGSVIDCYPVMVFSRPLILLNKETLHKSRILPREFELLAVHLAREQKKKKYKLIASSKKETQEFTSLLTVIYSIPELAACVTSTRCNQKEITISAKSCYCKWISLH